MDTQFERWIWVEEEKKGITHSSLTKSTTQSTNIFSLSFCFRFLFFCFFLIFSLSCFSVFLFYDVLFTLDDKTGDDTWFPILLYEVMRSKHMTQVTFLIHSTFHFCFLYFTLHRYSYFTYFTVLAINTFHFLLFLGIYFVDAHQHYGLRVLRALGRFRVCRRTYKKTGKKRKKEREKRGIEGKGERGKRKRGKRKAR